jgi:hypothetical protein
MLILLLTFLPLTEILLDDFADGRRNLIPGSKVPVVGAILALSIQQSLSILAKETPSIAVKCPEVVTCKE